MPLPPNARATPRVRGNHDRALREAIATRCQQRRTWRADRHAVDTPALRDLVLDANIARIAARAVYGIAWRPHPKASRYRPSPIAACGGRHRSCAKLGRGDGRSRNRRHHAPTRSWARKNRAPGQSRRAPMLSWPWTIRITSPPSRGGAPCGVTVRLVIEGHRHATRRRRVVECASRSGTIDGKRASSSQGSWVGRDSGGGARPRRRRAR